MSDGTTHTPLQPLYPIYDGPLKPKHTYFDHTTSKLQTNPCSLYDKDEPEDRPAAVYKIKYFNCQAT